MVIEVHARDVVDDLTKKAVSNVDDFEWASQLRYTWDEDENGERGVTVRKRRSATSRAKANGSSRSKRSTSTAAKAKRPAARRASAGRS